MKEAVTSEQPRIFLPCEGPWLPSILSWEDSAARPLSAPSSQVHLYIPRQQEIPAAWAANKFPSKVVNVGGQNIYFLLT